MKINSFKVSNYKCFNETGETLLSDGFNIFIGQNNAGKSALLDALSLKFTGKPHRSLSSLPTRTAVLKTKSILDISFSISGNEFKEILSSTSESFFVPVPADDPPNDKEKFLNDLFELDEIMFRVRVLGKQGGETKVVPIKIPSFLRNNCYRVTDYKHTSVAYYRYLSDPSKGRFIYQGNVSSVAEDEAGLLIANNLKEKIYNFKAERLNVGRCNFGNSATLKSDASNLPEALHVLQSRNRVRFERYNDLIKEIFPLIHEVRTRPVPEKTNEIEVVVWNIDPATERDDLTNELSESGTGVGQVLAILYVAINSDFPRTIIIDEPNTFLHPSASRKLIEILSQFEQHQFIISTHSSEIIKAANPNTLGLLKWEESQSTIESLDVGQIDSVKKCLIEVGAKLSDVFGADNILWVEGPTEEECFPKILKKSADAPMLLGTSIVAVKNTGDFSGRRKGLIFNVYEKLSQGNALMPPAIAFIFDKEKLTSKEMEDLQREAKGLLYFLPRRTYENYLINPAAIAAIMNELETFKESPINEEAILEWIKEKGQGKTYLSQKGNIPELFNDKWLKEVDGARLLQDLFAQLSGKKESYNKTTHSVLLTDWLLEKEPSCFSEIVELLRGILDTRKTSEEIVEE